MSYDGHYNEPSSVVGNRLAKTIHGGDSASPIRDGVSQAEQFLSEIHICVDEIKKRLDTVLTPQPPMPIVDGRAPKNQAIASHLSGRMLILNEGFGHVVSRLRDICRRVEV